MVSRTPARSFAERCRRGFDLGGVDVAEQDGRAAPVELGGGGQADAAGRAGDRDDLAGQLLCSAHQVPSGECLDGSET